MNKKQWCALKGALKDTVGFWGFLFGVFVALSACGIAIMIGLILLWEYISLTFPILKEPIPPELFTYGIILCVVFYVIYVIYIEIKRSYDRHMKKC